MAYLLPLGIVNKNNQSKMKIFGTEIGVWLLVNPESITIKRTPSISASRTMGGNVFQAWPNRPDEVEFGGIFYGFRSLYELRVITDSTSEPTDNKEVDLIYKYQKYSGYITNLRITASADKPWIYTYSFNFISKDAISLARLMLGNINSIAAEASYANGVVQNLRDIVKTKDQALVLNSLASVAGAAYFYATNKKSLGYLLGNTSILLVLNVFKSYARKNKIL